MEAQQASSFQPEAENAIVKAKNMICVHIAIHTV